MPILELNDIARQLVATAPADGPAHQALLDRLVEIVRTIDRGANRTARENLDGAMLLMTYLVQSGSIGGEEIHPVVARLIRNASDHLEPPRAEEEQTALANVSTAQSRLSPLSGNGSRAVGDMLLGEVLLKRGWILPQDVERALDVCASSGVQFGEALVRVGAVTWPQVEEALKYQDDCRHIVQGLGHIRPSHNPPEGKKLRLARPTKEGLGLRLMTDVLLGEIMVKNLIISRDQLQRGLEHQRATGMRLGEALVDIGCCNWDQVEFGVQLQGQARRYAS